LGFIWKKGTVMSTLEKLTDPADFSGKQAGDAAREQNAIATKAQQEALEAATLETQRTRAQAQGFLEPFGGGNLGGVDQAGFLTDPNAQFDFLQSNPLFQLGLDNANQVTEQNAASRGRLSAGDTLQQLSNNALLQATPLIDRQRADVNNLLNLGTGVATSQANIETGQAAKVGELTTSGAAAQAAGIIGANNARATGTGNVLSILGMGA
jgi:hypothetical protein